MKSPMGFLLAFVLLLVAWPAIKPETKASDAGEVLATVERKPAAWIVTPKIDSPEPMALAPELMQAVYDATVPPKKRLEGFVMKTEPEPPVVLATAMTTTTMMRQAACANGECGVRPVSRQRPLRGLFPRLRRR